MDLYNIPKRSRVCTECESPFHEGVRYLSLINETKREDFCDQCAKDAPNAEVSWKGEVPKREEKVPTPDEKALLLFQEENDEKTRFLLALYLERRKQIVRRREIKKKGHFVYEVLESGAIHAVKPLFVTKQEGDTLFASLTQKFDDTPTR